MHLWGEAGNFIASYDRTEDREMCRFLADMVDRQCYTSQPEAGMRAENTAPAHALA